LDLTYPNTVSELTEASYEEDRGDHKAKKKGLVVFSDKDFAVAHLYASPSRIRLMT
jgi:hypothetical protein